MKKLLILAVGILLVATGVVGKYNEDNYPKLDNNYESFNNSVTHIGMNRSYRLFDNNNEKYSEDDLMKEVVEYIDLINSDFAVLDVLAIEDTSYYFSIIETSTGKGAFELVIDPYTKNIYPAMGPNIMWNLKYNSNYGENQHMGKVL